VDQQFRVSEGASIIVGNKLFRGPCVLPDEVAEHLTGTKAGRSGKSSLEDHVLNGYIIPVGTQFDLGLLQPGVRREDQPVLPTDANKDPSAPTGPDKLVESFGGRAITPGESEINFPGGNSATVTNGEGGSGFNLTDEQLEGLDLDTLNSMVIERLPEDERGSFDAYETLEEARAALQADLVRQ